MQDISGSSPPPTSGENLPTRAAILDDYKEVLTLNTIDRLSHATEGENLRLKLMLKTELFRSPIDTTNLHEKLASQFGCTVIPTSIRLLEANKDNSLIIVAFDVFDQTLIDFFRTFGRFLRKAEYYPG